MTEVTYLNADHARRYWDAIFGSIQFEPEDTICIRGIGEKGTESEDFKSDYFFQPAFQPGADICAYFAEKYSTEKVATFILPCTLSAAKGTAANVKSFTNILIDLDSGDTQEKLAYLQTHVGNPSLVVASGGIVKETESKKVHVYYILDKPTENIAGVVRLRDSIASKVGGDPQFGLGVPGNPYGRAHQPVRVAGSVHSKNNVLNSCEIIYESGKRYDLNQLQHLIEEMPHAPFAKKKEEELKMESGVNFSPEKRELITTLTNDVYEGGEDVTRFSEFSRVAGHNIGLMRRENMSMNDAYEATMGWVTAHMHPAKPEEWCRREFHAILQNDLGRNGAMPIRMEPIFKANDPLGLKAWAAHRWAIEPKPVHDFLVEKLIVKGEPHLFVAEGGTGKTGLLIDLALKIASYQPGDNEEWCGNKITKGGTVVLILNEDSMREAHIRIVDIDKHRLKEKAGDKCIIVPMTAIGGAFPLVEIDPRTRLPVPSEQWKNLLSELAKIDDLAMVSFDTFASITHGSENDVNVISELFREANKICGKFGAALLFSHHIRKQDTEKIINSLRKLAAEIRGSSNITSSCRVVFGIYHCPDYDRRMRALGLVPKYHALFKFGMLKANINGLLEEEKTLLRNEDGVLIDVTIKDKFAHVNNEEREAWLLKAIEVAAQKGHPYKRGRKNANGVHVRRSELPEILKKVGQYEFETLIENLLQERKLFLCSKTEGSTKDLLDVCEGGFVENDFSAEMSAGAFKSPDWEKDFEYAANRGCVVEKREGGGVVF